MAGRGGQEGAGGGGRRMRERIRENEAAKRRPIFSALPLRGRPLADIPTSCRVGTRVARKAASSENPGAYFAVETPRFSKSFPALATSCGQRATAVRIIRRRVAGRRLSLRSEAASPKNPRVISAGRPRQNPKEIPCVHVLRAANRRYLLRNCVLRAGGGGGLPWGLDGV